MYLNRKLVEARFLLVRSLFWNYEVVAISKWTRHNRFSDNDRRLAIAMLLVKTRGVHPSCI
jgi:hypothetical protein